MRQSSRRRSLSPFDRIKRNSNRSSKIQLLTNDNDKNTASKNSSSTKNDDKQKKKRVSLLSSKFADLWTTPSSRKSNRDVNNANNDEKTIISKRKQNDINSNNRGSRQRNNREEVQPQLEDDTKTSTQTSGSEGNTTTTTTTTNSKQKQKMENRKQLKSKSKKENEKMRNDSFKFNGHQSFRFDNTRTSIMDGNNNADQTITMPTTSNKNNRSSQRSKRKSSSSSRKKKKKNAATATVSFTTVEVRKYPMILGDHPDCLQGPPITIDWEYYPPSKSYPINKFESKRVDHCRSYDNLDDLIIDPFVREQYLKKRVDVTDNEIEYVKTKIRYIQKHRQKQILMIEALLPKESKFRGLQAFKGLLKTKSKSKRRFSL